MDNVNQSRDCKYRCDQKLFHWLHVLGSADKGCEGQFDHGDIRPELSYMVGNHQAVLQHNFMYSFNLTLNKINNLLFNFIIKSIHIELFTIIGVLFWLIDGHICLWSKVHRHGTW